MRLPEQNPFRFRKRRSLNSKLYGDRQSNVTQSQIGHTGYPKEAGQTGPSIPKGYMSFFPQEYMPHAGFMDVFENIYEPYENAFDDMQQLNHKSVADEFRTAARAFARRIPDEVRYEDGLMSEEILQQQIEALREENGGLMPFDNNEISRQIRAAQAGNNELEMGQEPDMNKRHIQMAIDEAQCGLFTNTPTEVFDEDYFGPETMIGPMEDDFDAQQALFDELSDGTMEPTQSMIGQLRTEETNQSSSLEGIIEQEQMDDEGILSDGIMEMSGNEGPLMEPQEARQEPLQQYGGMMPQEMYNEPMQDPMDQLMMQGYGPMLDPYGQMLDPFGPMPGPGPGGP